MSLVAKFWVAFVLAMMLPHIGGVYRLPVLALFALALYDLLWRGLRNEDP